MVFSWCPFSEFAAMAPKLNQQALLKKFEDEKRRELILDLHAAGKSYSYIMKEVERIFHKKVGKSTVQMVVKRFKDRLTTISVKPPGRPSKMTTQYACF